MPRTILHFAPRGAEEAAAILRACTRLKTEGRPLRVGILESPECAREGLRFEEAASPGVPAAASATAQIESLDPRDEATVILSHAEMSGIREISKTDFLAVVEGGVRFGDFAAAVREAGLFFPHEPDERTRGTTIAGLVMSGVRFPTDDRYGRLREYVLALELAIPKGEVIRTGSRSVKDVTGYDLAGFIMGAGGRCGMIAKATMRLLQEPLGGASDYIAKNCAQTPGPANAGADERRAKILSDLSERLYEVFDPAHVMMGRRECNEE